MLQFVMGLTDTEFNGGICVTTGDMAWVGLSDGSMSEIDREGTRTRTVKLSKTWCSGITRTDDGWLVAGFNDRKIYRVSLECRVSTWATTNFRPEGLTAVSKDIVLVCGGDAGLFSVTEQSERLVDLCRDIYDVATNKRGDVAVTSRNGHRVLIMDREYTHLGCYKGQPHTTKPFRPRGVTSDGNVFIVCDSDNHRLHFIDRCGVCLFVYKTARHCPGKEPWRVDMMPGSRLWVKFGGGSICVYDLPQL